MYIKIGQKISKDTEDLNNTINQLDLIDIYRRFQPTVAESTLFSRAHGTFTKINYFLSKFLYLLYS